MHFTPAALPHKGWQSRGRAVPSASFKPTSDKAVFAALLMSPVDPEGFSAAFFAPNVVVDARGAVHEIKQADWDAIVNLANKAATDLPDTGRFNDQWRVKHDMTSQAIEWLSIKQKDGSFKEVCVYGFDGDKDDLEEPVAGHTKLPPVIKDLFGLLTEARAEYNLKGKPEDKELIAKVKEVLGA